MFLKSINKCTNEAGYTPTSKLLTTWNWHPAPESRTHGSHPWTRSVQGAHLSEPWAILESSWAIHMGHYGSLEQMALVWPVGWTQESRYVHTVDTMLTLNHWKFFDEEVWMPMGLHPFLVLECRVPRGVLYSTRQLRPFVLQLLPAL